MTSGVVYINGVRLTAAVITAHAFTASKDTYVDFQDNADGTAHVYYTEATTNAASPALANSGTTANTIRVAIIVSGAGNIAAATSVNQGQETMVLPIASSIPYAVTDSLGNLICPRDPNRKILGYRQIISDFSTTGASATYIVGLTCPVSVPTGRKVKITIYTNELLTVASTNQTICYIYEGATAGALTTLLEIGRSAAVGAGNSCSTTVCRTPASSPIFYTAAISSASGSFDFAAAATSPAYILVELV
jgi:hypothetical protein